MIAPFATTPLNIQETENFTQEGIASHMKMFQLRTICFPDT
jgi:hypothetical protein